MNYYLIRHYSKGKFASSQYIEVEEGVKLTDYFNSSPDTLINEIDQAEFDHQSNHKKQTIFKGRE